MVAPPVKMVNLVVEGVEVLWLLEVSCYLGHSVHPFCCCCCPGFFRIPVAYYDPFRKDLGKIFWYLSEKEVKLRTKIKHDKIRY